MLTVALATVLFQAKSDLLLHVRKALMIEGASAWTQTSVTGKANYFGVPHEYSLAFWPNGSYVQTFKGPIGETFGYDGKTFWRIDPSRRVDPLDFEDKDRQLAISLMVTGEWLDSTAPVKISEDGYTLRLTLKTSGQTEVVKIDKTTWLPTEATLPISSGTLKLTFDDWKPAGDRRIPAHVEITDGGLTDTISVSDVQPGDPSIQSKPTLPSWIPDDVVFDRTKPAALVVEKAISGHLLVHPLINGQDVGWFILDSGAEVMVIDKKTADDAKLESVGRLPLTGVGGTVLGAFRPVSDFTLGPVTMKNVLFTELDLAQVGQILGIKLAGIVGADFMHRTVLTIDLVKPSVEVAPREGFALPSGNWVPIRFSTGNPAIEATTDGAPKAWYRFDTGANGTITFHSPFVRKHSLLKGKKTTASGSGGVGGTVATRSGPIKWFELGGHRFMSPVVTFAIASQGAFAEPYLAGNIGQDFMKPFKIVMDFAGHRIALVPR